MSTASATKTLWLGLQLTKLGTAFLNAHLATDNLAFALALAFQAFLAKTFTFAFGLAECIERSELELDGFSCLAIVGLF